MYLIGLAAGVLYLVTVVGGGQLQPGYTIYQAISELTLPSSPNHRLMTVSFVLFNILLLIYGVIIGINFSANSWLIFSGFVYVVVALAGFGMMLYPMDPKKGVDTKRGATHNNLATVAIVGAIIITISSTIGFSQIQTLRLLTRFSLLMSCSVALTALGAWISALRQSLAFGSWQKASLGLFMIWLGWSAVGLSSFRCISTLGSLCK